MTSRHSSRGWPVLLVAVWVSGCRGFEEGWRRFSDAAVDAAVSPRVWVPAVGAAALQIDDLDEDLADWATDHGPVFGSEERATDRSEELATIAVAAAVLNTLATPTGPDGRYDYAAKLRDVGGGLAAVFVTNGTTHFLKEGVDRERRSGVTSGSFPSGHTSMAASTSTLSLRYVDLQPWPDWGKTTLDVTYTALPYAVGWARVEAGKHYPTDVLAGVVLGSFFGELSNNLLDSYDNVSFGATPTEGGVLFAMTLRF